LEEGKLAEIYYRQLKQKPKSASQFVKNRSSQDEGSGVHGQQRSWEVATDANAAPSVTSFDQDLIRQQVAQAIAEQKNRSDIPLGWRRWADDRLRPQVNWRELLRRRTRGAATVGLGLRSDYRFDRPHRREQLYQPLLRPSLRTDSTPRIACVVDTSGSMSGRELGRVLAEIRGVLELLRMPITVIPCDAVPSAPVKILTDSDLLTLSGNLQGGGGTDMIAGIDSALALRPTPDMVLVLTDGYTPYPSRRCRTPIIFGILQAGSSITPEPPMPPWRPFDLCRIPL
jgi:predicted metal-dependent peptidase